MTISILGHKYNNFFLNSVDLGKICHKHKNKIKKNEKRRAGCGPLRGNKRDREGVRNQYMHLKRYIYESTITVALLPVEGRPSVEVAQNKDLSCGAGLSAEMGAFSRISTCWQSTIVFGP